MMNFKKILLGLLTTVFCLGFSSKCISHDGFIGVENLQNNIQAEAATGIMDYAEHEVTIDGNETVLPPLFDDNKPKFSENELKTNDSKFKLNEIEQMTNEIDLIKGTVSEKEVLQPEKDPNPVWQTIKGRVDKDSVMLGMWSKHMSSNKYRETHNLAALQYKGYVIGTFTNSHSDQVFLAGIARNVVRKQFGENTMFDLGYKLAPMYGYKKGVPNVGGFSVLPVVCLDTSYRNLGFTLNIFPSAAVSVNTYINLDMLKRNNEDR
ncbi:MAG: hypothetical protein GX568_03805 [Candidatus Gastranaerophilales bacterium]|nr:hypothetical protein [Candidatus Gastranaerophilales bacterium]